MVIAVISDTHMPRGARRLPDACLERLSRSDLIMHAGDVNTLSALDELERLGPAVRAVHGNADSAELRERLPESLAVDAGALRIGMVHDAGPARGRFDRMRRRFPDSDAVIFGHSHIALHERAGSFEIFNPGSPTDRRRAPNHTMGLVRVHADGARFELLALD